MNLEVGNYYLNASGEIVKIELQEKDIFIDTNGYKYFDDGDAIDLTAKYGLIAEIPKELHWNLMYNIKNFYTNGNVRKKLRRKYNNYINCCISKNKD